MPKVVFDKLNLTHRTPTLLHLQLADSSVRYPEGIAEDVSIRVRDYFIPVDFVVLNMEISKETPLILGRPFLSTAGAHIDVGAGEIRFNINGKEERFPFRPKKEQCSMINNKYRPNVQEEAEESSPKKEPTTTYSKRRQLKKVWRKVESSSLSTSPGRAE